MQEIIEIINPSASTVKLTDEEIIAKASKAKTGEQFSKLWAGDASKYKSHEAADLKFCSMLAFWCSGNAEQMDRIFRQSGLMRPKWDEVHGEKAYGFNMIEKAVKGCSNFYGQNSKNKFNPSIINPNSDVTRYTPTDKGNGFLFADSFQNELRFCPEKKEWFRYDKTRWISGGNEIARERAKEVVDFLEDFSRKIGNEDRRKRFENNAQLLCNHSKRETMLKDASSVHPLYLSELDTELDFFNCRNGTLNLKEGKFLVHDSAHNLGKVAGADYIADAKCKRWEKFLSEIMMGDKDMVLYLQKLFGYCLTGNPKEEKLFIFYGPTARNGKSTLLDTVAAVMGDYARSILSETLAEQKNLDGSKASPDLAEMAGVRLGAVSEPFQGLHFNAAKVKIFTGRNTIKARFLYSGFFEFKPQFSIIIDTNHQPVISDNTLFASDRVVIIPFNKHFEEWERDPNLKSELLVAEARSGILSWMLEGLKLYRAEGLTPPQAIKDEIARYEFDSDKTAQFIEECIEVVPTQKASVLISTVYAAYVAWCRGNGFHAKSQKNFRSDLETKGLQIKKRNAGNCVLDINVIGYLS